ncbi:MAG: 3-oxoacyl-[acyl-carrier-protein] synthase III C-terminal domain-containing protein [Anaerolineae bacterium]
MAAEIDTRYSVLPSADFLADEPGLEPRNDRYLQAARKLAAPVISAALEQAGLAPAEIDHFLVVSCTGLDTPGLDVTLAADLGMRPNLRRSALIGMGCHAGLTGLDRAMLALAALPGSRALLLALEFGTLHFQHGSKIDDMVAGAIFGDGLAAAVIGPAAPERGGHFRLLRTATYADYSRQAMMGVHPTDTGFQIYLSTRVAKTLRELVPPQVDSFLQQAGLSRADVRFWGIHPGGAKIVEYLGAALGLPDDALRFSRSVLRQYGNMSSATIFFVLDEIIRQGRPQPGDIALLQSFGPGLTIELCLARWH